MQGFLANLNKVYTEGDEEGRAERDFVEAWAEEFGTAAVGVTDLFGIAEDCFDLGYGPVQAQRTRLGRTIIPRLKNRVIADRFIRDAGTYQGARRWRLEAVPGPSDRV